MILSSTVCPKRILTSSITVLVDSMSHRRGWWLENKSQVTVWPWTSPACWKINLTTLCLRWRYNFLPFLSPIPTTFNSIFALFFPMNIEELGCCNLRWIFLGILVVLQTLIEQNQQRTRQIPIQNPLLTRALFQVSSYPFLPIFFYYFLVLSMTMWIHELFEFWFCENGRGENWSKRNSGGDLDAVERASQVLISLIVSKYLTNCNL